jgi:hypothetical protein
MGVRIKFRSWRKIAITLIDRVVSVKLISKSYLPWPSPSGIMSQSCSTTAMHDSAFASRLLELSVAMTAVIGLATLLLRWRDRAAQSHGKTSEQVRARFAAILQFRSTLERCIPGVLIIIFGIFFALDRGRQHEPDWWIGILFIPAGWVLVPLLARKSWRRYLELRRLADKSEYDYASTEHQ